MGVEREDIENLHQVMQTAELVYDAADIAGALDALAARLDDRLQGTIPLVLCVMQGGVIFTGHLVTRMRCMLQMDYVHATRYHDQTLGAELEWLVYPRSSLQDRTVLILDDILDEGLTLRAIRDYCVEHGAKDVITAVLLDKHHDRRVADIKADYAALQVSDRYVFGFGMDYKGQLRHLDSIYALAE